MRARYYNQDIKRFINRDVVSGDIGNSQSLNRYCYVQGNPVSLTDPFGLCPDGNSEDGVSKDSAIGWLLYKIDPSGGLFDKYSNVVSPWLHTGLGVGGIFHDGADALNGILYFLEGNTKLGIEYTLRGLTFYGALIGGPVGVAMILLGIGFNIGFAVRGTAGAIDRAYTDYQNGTFGWHNGADLLLNGLGVVGGVHVGTKSLRRAADMSVPRTLETPPEIPESGRGKTNFDNEIPRSGTEWYEYLKGKYGADNVCWNFNSIEDIINDPTRLKGYTADELAKVLGSGWTRDVYGSAGGGWKFLKDDISIFYHPGGGRHGGSYYGISTATTGKIKVVNPNTYIPLPDDKATIIYETR